MALKLTFDFVLLFCLLQYFCQCFTTRTDVPCACSKVIATCSHSIHACKNILAAVSNSIHKKGKCSKWIIEKKTRHNNNNIIEF